MREFYTLTKMDIAALRQGDDVVVQRYVRSPDGEQKTRFDVIKRARRTDQNPFAEEIVHSVGMPVEFPRFSGRHDYSRANAFAMFGLYQSQMTAAWSCLSQLRAGDEVRCEFRADEHTTQSMQEAGFHGDVLVLEVRRNNKPFANFEIDASVCQNNSARMIRGVVGTAFPASMVEVA